MFLPFLLTQKCADKNHQNLIYLWFFFFFGGRIYVRRFLPALSGAEILGFILVYYPSVRLWSTFAYRIRWGGVLRLGGTIRRQPTAEELHRDFGQTRRLGGALNCCRYFRYCRKLTRATNTPLLRTVSANACKSRVPPRVLNAYDVLRVATQ